MSYVPPSQGGPQPGQTGVGQPTPGTNSQASLQAGHNLGPTDTVLITRARQGGSRDPQGGGTENKQTVATQRAWFYSLRGPDLTHLQDQLEAAGLLKRDASGHPTYGRGIVGDEATAQAYDTLLGRSVATGQTIDESLANATGSMSQYGTQTGPAKQGLVVQLTNPADIKKAVKDAASSDLGRGLTDKEASEFTTLYQALERNYQQQTYTAQGSGLPGGPGGTTVAPPSASAFADEQIQQRYPGEYGAHKIAAVGQEFFDLIRGA